MNKQPSTKITKQEHPTLNPKIPIEQKKQIIIGILKENARTKLTQINKLTKIPITTIWKIIKEINQEYDYTIVKKGKKND